MTDPLPYGPDVADDLAEPSREGLHIGPYRLSRPLGRGGMSQVYEAIHDEIGQRVAVKLLSVRLSRRYSARQRFLNEARAGAKIRHASLVKIFDHGVLPDGTPYILMDFLEGRTIRAHLAKLPDGRTSVAEAMRTGRQVASALAEAHARGVIHRDLKPENLMIVSDSEAPGGERVMVLDFGIAKFVEVPDCRTDPSRLPLGTPTYMSPEQCRGDDKIDGRSDVYSLGVVLYEMLCGRPPFLTHARDPSHVTFQHIWATPQPLRAMRRQIPGEVESLVLGMLQKNSRKRPDMTDVERALDQRLTEQLRLDSGPRLAYIWSLAALLGMLAAVAAWHYSGHHSLSQPNGGPGSMTVPPISSISTASPGETMPLAQRESPPASLKKTEPVQAIQTQLKNSHGNRNRALPPPKSRDNEIRIPIL